MDSSPIPGNRTDISGSEFVFGLFEGFFEGNIVRKGNESPFALLIRPQVAHFDDGPLVLLTFGGLEKYHRVG